jgi:hypothetical protein
MNARKGFSGFVLSAGLAVSLIAMGSPAFAQAGGGAGGGTASAPGSSGSVGGGAPGSNVGMPGPAGPPTVLTLTSKPMSTVFSRIV